MALPLTRAFVDESARSFHKGEFFVSVDVILSFEGRKLNVY